MVIIQKKISATFIAFILCVLGLYFMSSTLVVLNESTEFLQSYADDDLSNVKIESIKDTKLLMKLLEVEKGKTRVMLKLSQTLYSEIADLLMIGLILFFLLLLIITYFVFLSKKHQRI
ncbi:hypothetical protein [Candidatus Colwellia aromaticivorans]|uniref:hypothetical protein n=1 Tax=Candidatus Colwellia aromaticivorans TaxID=2267621 RepID=UPI000DF2E910|nr:hypothetical protein [Candidatus Colwellia aromaticivorans]